MRVYASPFSRVFEVSSINRAATSSTARSLCVAIKVQKKSALNELPDSARPYFRDWAVQKSQRFGTECGRLPIIKPGRLAGQKGISRQESPILNATPFCGFYQGAPLWIPAKRTLRPVPTLEKGLDVLPRDSAGKTVRYLVGRSIAGSSKTVFPLRTSRSLGPVWRAPRVTLFF